MKTIEKRQYLIPAVKKIDFLARVMMCQTNTSPGMSTEPISDDDGEDTELTW